MHHSQLTLAHGTQQKLPAWPSVMTSEQDLCNLIDKGAGFCTQKIHYTLVSKLPCNLNPASYIQWNLRERDTLGKWPMSLACKEVVPISEVCLFFHCITLIQVCFQYIMNYLQSGLVMITVSSDSILYSVA